ncbi:hypothetical protein LXA47_16550, partial [Massilia sp. P8910]|uniref:hypothetical protein n=1 Tax=Massilia antarctica TaxID=2765360 RepID=UPI001E42C823
MTEKKRHARVRSLIGEVRQIAPGKLSDVWLNTVEQDAIQCRPGARERFEGFVTSMVQSGQISQPVADGWLGESERCMSAELRFEHVAFFSSWTLLVSLTTLAWLSKQVSLLMTLAAIAVLGTVSAAWTYRMGLVSIPTKLRQVPWKITFSSGLIIALGSMGVLLPGLVTILSQQASFRVFSRQQKEFVNDPDGFKWIANFGKSKYD